MREWVEVAAGKVSPGGKGSKRRVGVWVGWGGSLGGEGRRTWQRLMMSASVASRSTTLPLPSSPHCAPSTTVTREPVAAASCCSRPRLTPPAPGGRSLEARVADMPPAGPLRWAAREPAREPARPGH